MPNVGPMEVLLLAVLALLLFGPKKLPEIGRSVGKGIREFKEGVAGQTSEFHEALEPFTGLADTLDPSVSDATVEAGVQEHDA
jgi:sec-independent protein translocase protein TatA